MTAARPPAVFTLRTWVLTSDPSEGCSFGPVSVYGTEADVRHVARALSEQHHGASVLWFGEPAGSYDPYAREL